MKTVYKVIDSGSEDLNIEPIIYYVEAPFDIKNVSADAAIFFLDNLYTLYGEFAVGLIEITREYEKF